MHLHIYLDICILSNYSCVCIFMCKGIKDIFDWLYCVIIICKYSAMLKVLLYIIIYYVCVV